MPREDGPGAVDPPADVCTTPEGFPEEDGPAGAPGEENSPAERYDDSQGDKVCHSEICGVEFCEGTD